MLEALWSVEFVANTQMYGAGIVVLETGRIFGGDSLYYYVGGYTIDPIATDTVTVKIKIKHYNGPLSSIFGQLDNFNIELKGKYAQDTFDMNGHRVEDPTKLIALRLTRRAELP